ncbi:hypothetical protein BU24DRAFT_250664 [Aaosphaeria arxii CBS 175.79]|uniref:Uncharacterized protein n=1 Tax=Aaosphaeria arxii CBS 175.79 TaxID=1450172 RepID=A0A6A5XM33_9PLEO|nr:uncharacterized protein BU24DRAFT_250664 [Aaosphaeria arxii CBS 175.79]KAF2014003.1 hypothetical protein BU24DRAFT_250664 [Aaosphaeria arxii CBS 175.79]
MVSTRSKTAQSRIEDFAVKNNGTSATVKSSTKDQSQNSGRKRESVDVALLEPKHKRMKSAQSHSEESAMLNEEGDSKPIIINRAPVLQLWSASVINSTYPGLSWETCLSVGSAVSSICAVAKGRSVGKMPIAIKLLLITLKLGRNGVITPLSIYSLHERISTI